jgi:hypothetical protein
MVPEDHPLPAGQTRFLRVEGACHYVYSPHSGVFKPAFALGDRVPYVLPAGTGLGRNNDTGMRICGGKFMKELNAWTASGAESASLVRPEHVAPDQRLQRAEDEVRRLTRCMEMKHRQLCELRKALAHSVTVHYPFEVRLQRELDSLRIMMPVNGLKQHWSKAACPPGRSRPSGLSAHR